jgi:ubiquinone/menaquinone biosynthesis C-methylase UbiE
VVVAAAIVSLAALVRRSFDGQRWYQMVYLAFYLARLRIWERRLSPSDLIELIEGPHALAPGRALDLGCGTGTDSIYLARHGWDVTGVDMVHEALAIARHNAAISGVQANFVQGDVTRLRELVQGDFDLLFDFGWFHTLPLDQRPTYVDCVSAVAAPGATFLLYGFAGSPRLAPILARVNLDEVRRRFSRDWEIISAEPTSPAALQLDLPPESFDVAHFSNVLRYMREQERAVQLAFRFLKSGATN